MARQDELRYNIAMTLWYRHPRFWFSLTLAVVLIVAVALWLRGTSFDGAQSPLPTPKAAAVSPLTTPSPENAAPSLPSAWSSGGAILLWVALGILLALGLAFVILRWYRGAA
ncbi:MAG: hypothetical protein GY832_15140 [Chloroflexi bacterium]|nr:hypothetical protein [Chloroflexota bacterium]